MNNISNKRKKLNKKIINPIVKEMILVDNLFLKFQMLVKKYLQVLALKRKRTQCVPIIKAKNQSILKINLFKNQ